MYFIYKEKLSFTLFFLKSYDSLLDYGYLCIYKEFRCGKIYRIPIMCKCIQNISDSVKGEIHLRLKFLSDSVFPFLDRNHENEKPSARVFGSGQVLLCSIDNGTGDLDVCTSCYTRPAVPSPFIPPRAHPALAAATLIYPPFDVWSGAPRLVDRNVNAIPWRTA